MNNKQKMRIQQGVGSLADTFLLKVADLTSTDAVGDNWRFGTLRLDVRPDGGR